MKETKQDSQIRWNNLEKEALWSLPQRGHIIRSGNTIGFHTLMQSATGIQQVAERVGATFLKIEKKGHTYARTGTHTHTAKK